MEKADEPRGITSISDHFICTAGTGLDTGQDYARCWNQNKVGEADE
jgi:hypothetical protein